MELTDMNAEIRYFSATGTTKKIINSFALGLNCDVRFVDFTQPENRVMISPVESDLEVLAVPIHGERIPGFIRKYLKRIKGNGKPLVVFSIYGNVGIGISLAQFSKLSRDNDFRLIGTGTFIGQHSFANSHNRVGFGRPNEADLAQAQEFGKRIREKLDTGSLENIELPSPVIPTFIEGFPERGTRFIIKQPAVEINVCKRCGVCIRKCPVNAIDSVSYQVDETKCIRCLSCVKNCPSGARKAGFRLKIFDTVFGYMGKTRKENRIYI
jgi:ferredoxin